MTAKIVLEIFFRREDKTRCVRLSVSICIFLHLQKFGHVVRILTEYSVANHAQGKKAEGFGADVLPHEQRQKTESHNRHQLDEDVEGRPSCVFQRVADRIPDNTGLMLKASFPAV